MATGIRPFADAGVEAVFRSVAEGHKAHFLRIRELIFVTADELALPGGIEETLKWGEPSYVPVKPKTGSAVRLASFDREQVGLLLNCQTRLSRVFGQPMVTSWNTRKIAPFCSRLTNSYLRPLLEIVRVLRCIITSTRSASVSEAFRL